MRGQPPRCWGPALLCPFWVTSSNCLGSSLRPSAGPLGTRDRNCISYVFLQDSSRCCLAQFGVLSPTAVDWVAYERQKFICTIKTDVSGEVLLPVFLLCPHVAEETRELSRTSLLRTLSPVTKAPPS